jgi:hypothetical protein
VTVCAKLSCAINRRHNGFSRRSTSDDVVLAPTSAASGNKKLSGTVACPQDAAIGSAGHTAEIDKAATEPLLVASAEATAPNMPPTPVSGSTATGRNGPSPPSTAEMVYHHRRLTAWPSPLAAVC